MPNPRFDNTKLRNYGAIDQRGSGGTKEETSPCVFLNFFGVKHLKRTGQIYTNSGQKTSHPFKDENFGQVWKAEKRSKPTRS
jgi:hypothetical protein